ncbi:MAG: hypothetical protein ACYCVM_07750, partial [Acidiferrobacter sp.]
GSDARALAIVEVATPGVERTVVAAAVHESLVTASITALVRAWSGLRVTAAQAPVLGRPPRAAGGLP